MIVSIEGVHSSWSVTQDSAANTAQTLTKAAVANKKHYITSFSVSISAAATANDVGVTLQDGDTVLWKGFIGQAAARGSLLKMEFPMPVVISGAAKLAVGAAGAACLTTANLEGYTL